MAEGAPRQRRGRILFAILGLLLAVGVLPLVYTSFDLVSRSRQSIEGTQQEWQLDKARLISTQVAIYVESLRSQVGAIARTLEMDAGPGGFPARVARIGADKSLERYLQASAKLVYVSVVDPTGVGAQSGLALQDARLLEQLQEAFQRGQHGTAMISVPVVSESLQEPVVVLGEPVLSGGGVLGVVLAIASLQDIREITTATGGQLFEVYVVDNRGRLIAHSDPKQPLAADMSAIEIVRIFLQSSEDPRGARPEARGAAASAARPVSTSWRRASARGACSAPTCGCRTTRAGASSSRATSIPPTTRPSTSGTSR